MIRLVCPVDRSRLHESAEVLSCVRGHDYPIDEYSGIPRLIDVEGEKPFHFDSTDPLGRHPSDYPKLRPGDVDDFVQNQIRATGGYLYKPMGLRQYPQPDFPLDPSGLVVDVGCGWGRWSIAAAAKGWKTASVDPWLDNCRALQRIAGQFELSSVVQIVNGDGRRLPFSDASADAAFSYSVLQHLSKGEALVALTEMMRVVRPGGTVLVQMPNVAGLRQRLLYRRGEVADEGFKVRPWTLHEIEEVARSLSASWSITVDGFFSLNAQWSERAALPRRSQVLVAASELFRRASSVVRPLSSWADSLWLTLVVEK